MSCIPLENLAMRKIANRWFVKNLVTQRIFELAGALAVLWDMILKSQNILVGSNAFLDYYGQQAAAVADLPKLIKTLSEFQLLTISANKASNTEESHCTSGLKLESDTVYDSIYKASLECKQPVLAEFEMTYRCNLRCRYCYQPEYLKLSKKNELSKEEISKLIQEMAEFGIFFLIITGGECTLMPNFLHVLQEARKYNMDITVLTNGTVIKPTTIAAMLKNKVSEVRVSIYGSSSTQYHDFTGSKLAYTRVMNNL